MKNIITNIFRGIFITALVILISAISIPREWFASESIYLYVKATLGLIADIFASLVIKFSISEKMRDSKINEPLLKIYKGAFVIIPFSISVWISVILLSSQYLYFDLKIVFPSLIYLSGLIDFVFSLLIGTFSMIKIKEETGG